MSAQNTAKSKTFLRFPLCFLAYGDSPKNRLHSIAEWCAWDVGKTRTKSLSADQAQDILSEFNATFPQGFRQTKPDHVSYVVGMAATCLSGGSIQAVFDRVKLMNEFLNGQERSYGRQPYASIRHDLFWEAVNGTGFNYAELCILAAITSFIGTRARAYIARSVIQSRALGYKTPAIMEKELPSRSDGATPLTQSQQATLVNRLHERRFFARQRKDPWHTYYSIRSSQDELEKAMLGGVSYKTKFHDDRKSRTREFMAAMKSARGGANVNIANVNIGGGVHGAFTEASPSVHSAFTLAPFTLQNCNTLTETRDIELQHKSTLTSQPETPTELASKGTSKETEEKDHLSRFKRADGSLMTVRQAEEYTAKCKAEAGLI